MEFLIIILVFILIICIHKEKNVYEPFLPDERQYNVCIDSNLGQGETHLSIHTNQVPQPTTGFLTSLLNITEEKTLGKYFNVHECSPQNVGKVNEIDYIFNHNIIDHSNNKQNIHIIIKIIIILILIQNYLLHMNTLMEI